MNDVISVNGQVGLVEINASDIPILDANEVYNGDNIELALQEIGLKVGDISKLETIDKTDLVHAINEVRSVLPVEVTNLKGSCNDDGTIITLTWQNACSPLYRGREIYISTSDITAKDREWCIENAILIESAIGSGRNNVDSVQYTVEVNKGYYFKVFTRYYVNLKESYGRGVGLYMIATPKIIEVVPIEKGGTGATTVEEARNALGLGKTSGALPVENGGTGATDTEKARENLGLGDVATLSIVPIENGGTGATTVAGIHTNLGEVDYVVEQGTSGIWAYRKWNSGIAECWGKTSLQPISVTSAWAGLYYGNIPAVSLPFQFVSVPFCYASAVDNGSNWSIQPSSGGSTTQTRALYAISPVYGTYSIAVEYLVIGRWK